MKQVSKKISGKEARTKMLEGVNEAANVVGSTMGAKGRNVVLERDGGSPMVVNDGVTICREISFADPIKNMGVQLLRDAANKTNQEAGDGTTTTIVLARAILKNGWEVEDKGGNPVIFRRELESATGKVLKNLESFRDEVFGEDTIKSVAKISVQDEDLGNKIGAVMYKVGASGAISIKPSLKKGVYIEQDGGMRLEGQLIGGVVDNGDRWETVLNNARVLILKENIEDHEYETKWIPLVRQFAKADEQGKVHEVLVPNFLVIAEKLPRRVVMMMNNNKDLIKWVWFRPTTAVKNMKEIYKDLQSLIGGKIVSDEDGVFLRQMGVADLGVVDMATIGRHDAVLTVSTDRLSSNEYLDRCNDVKGQMENAEDEIELEQIKERYGNLTGGVAAIKVAAATEQETMELKLRIEDAVNATRSAMDSGTVSGGGVALYNAARKLKGETDGEKVLKAACEAPILQILHNAGMEAKINKLQDGFGYDVLTENEVDMKKEGIIDPFKVVAQALINAVSVAGLLLTSEYVVTNEEDETEKVKKFFNAK